MAQTTYYVDGACGDDSWSGLSPECGVPDGPKASIREAITGTKGGDTVVVAPGSYSLLTDAPYLRKPITLRSSGGPFVTTLDAEGGDAVINVYLFDGGPGIIEGFTITRVKTQYPAPVVLADADLMLVDCRFVDNKGWYAGAVWDEVGSFDNVTVIDCVFQGNTGGGVGAVGGWKVDIIGSTFVDNAAAGNAQSAVGFEAISIANGIFRGAYPHIGGDGPVTYSNIQGGYPGEGNIDADPIFVDEAAGDLRLAAGSPCIDAGDNIAVPAWVRVDLAGLERFADDPDTKDTGKGTPPIVDMGAHEFQVSCYPDFTADGLLDLFDFLAYLNAFNASEHDADCTKDGPLDLFDFLCFVNAFNQGC